MIYLTNNSGNTITVNLGAVLTGQTYKLILEKDGANFEYSGLTDTSQYVDRYSQFINVDIESINNGFYDYYIYDANDALLDKGISYIKFNEPVVSTYTITKTVKTYKKNNN